MTSIPLIANRDAVELLARRLARCRILEVPKAIVRDIELPRAVTRLRAEIAFGTIAAVGLSRVLQHARHCDPGLRRGSYFPRLTRDRPGNEIGVPLMATDARVRSLWYLHPLQSSNQPATDFTAEAVRPGETIEREITREIGASRATLKYLARVGQSPQPKLVTRIVRLYGPTDHELELMRGWGYDCNNPDWKRFANELGRQSLIAGRVLPNNWQSQREFRDLTASDLVNWMKSLRDGDDRERDDDDETAFVPSLQLRNDRDLNAVKCSRLIDKFGVESLKPVDGKIRFRKPSPGKLLIHAGDWYNYWADQEARQFAAMDDLPDYIAGARDREAKVQKRQRKPR